MKVAVVEQYSFLLLVAMPFAPFVAMPGAP